MEKHNLLTNHQYDLRGNSSPSFALCDIHDNLLRNVDQSLFVSGLFLDLSKEFDTVDHTMLFTKVESLGIRVVALKRCLINRFQHAKVNGYSSSTKRIMCRVPQGSTLGPILCLICVNDLPLCIKFSVTLYAVNTYLMLSDERIDYLEQKVNAELIKIGYWLRANKLTLN